MTINFIRDATAETKPCPFCGNDDNQHRSMMALKMNVLIHYIKCESCAACGPLSASYPDEQSAIAAWNERKVPAVDAEYTDVSQFVALSEWVEN